MNYGLTETTYVNLKKVINKYNKYIFKIFGSRARGDYKKNSDIDIVVYNCFDKNDEFQIKNEIDKINTPYTIDLVFFNDITKKEFKESIKKEAIDFE